MLKYGAASDYLLDLADDDMEAIPEPLLKEPVLPPHLTRYMDAFIALSDARSQAFAGANAITIADMAAYWQAAPCEPFAEFVTLIQAMDSVFVAWIAQKVESSNR